MIDITGKTAIAVDAIINQNRLKYENDNFRIFCIYVAIWTKEVNDCTVGRDVT